MPLSLQFSKKLDVLQSRRMDFDLAVRAFDFPTLIREQYRAASSK